MTKLINVDTEDQIAELNLNASSAPQLNERIKMLGHHYMVTSRVYNLNEEGRVDDLEIWVTQLE